MLNIEEWIWDNILYFKPNYQRIIVMHFLLKQQGNNHVQKTREQLMDKVREELGLNHYSVSSFNTDLSKWREMLKKEYNDDTPLPCVGDYYYCYGQPEYTLPFLNTEED
jgi:hypothetical protein